ncbi:glucosylglycerol 3-phosphatase [Stutzerimonas tarimensis]|uniref:Glucosylglycerol 3-phosphatase n=1 Tax=Stutzerimonas tarimensis TaxID=1507735 RepID=A0ABV7TBX9_9GAMM
MTYDCPIISLDHTRLLDSLAATDNLLVIQDLDGVCMGLVKDPLTRVIDRRYVEAAQRLVGHFYVLTNGEHIGSRGVNGIVEKAFETPGQPAEQGFYLPGLAAGGVQLQDRHGQVSHPGVTDEELAFLQAIPAKAEAFLQDLLAAAPYGLSEDEAAPLVASSVLDNLVSPTLNLNNLHQRFIDQPDLYPTLQQAAQRFMEQLEREAAEAGLTDAFFIHYAPNLGHDEQGRERVKSAEGTSAGTTDFQFMLKGAVKEVGVLVILNHYYFQRTGHYPLGEHFNARQAPRDPEALLQLARDTFDPVHMPCIVGVGDTVTSYANEQNGQTQWLRGGSDRGFLTLVQALGKAFGSDNRVLYIDSSAGEVRRPGVDAALLQRHADDPAQPPWAALKGISDAEDPLKVDVIFCGGHRQYVEFFCALAERFACRQA